MEKNSNRKGSGKLTRRILIGIMTFWIGSIALTEVLLSTPMVTAIVNRIASQYIDGNISFGKVSASLLKNFPAMTFNLEDLCITYPADRFDIDEQTGPQGALMYRGCGEEADTLATFSRFSASVNITPLIFGRFMLPQISLEGPRIFAHSYSSGRSNWEIFVTGDETAEEVLEDEETAAATELPDITIGNISLTGNSQIVYTSTSDTTFALIELKRAEFDGRLTTGKTLQNKIGFAIDSMFVAGRVSSDTLAVGLDRLRINEHNGQLDVDMQAKSIVASKTFGRMSIPVNLAGSVNFPQDSVFAVGVHNLKAEIAAIPFEGEADVRFHEDRMNIDGKLSVEECRIDDILKKFVKNFIPEVSDIRTDAVVALNARCRGDYIYETGKLPTFSVDLIMPHTTIEHMGLGEKLDLAFDAYVANTRQGQLNVNINEIVLNTDGFNLDAYGGMTDALSNDPTISIDGSMSASLDTLMRFIPDSLGLLAEGRIAAKISGKAKMSQLNMYTFSTSSLTGKAHSDVIKVEMPQDSLSLKIEGMHITLGPESRASRRDSTRVIRLMGITGLIEKIDASYKEEMSLNGDSITLSAKSSATDTDTSQVQRLSGRFIAKSLAMSDASGTGINLNETENGFLMMPKRDNPKIPVLSLTSSNKRITLTTDVNRAILTDAALKAKATMNTAERRQRMRHIRDSLAKVYPDVPEDSLLYVARAKRQTAALPSWLQEEDFRKQDIDIRLDQSMAKYFRDWDLDGSIDIRTGIIMTPYFPLRNIIRGLQMTFTNDRIGVDSIKFASGKSTIQAKGELTGLRRALLGSGRSGRSTSTLNLNMEFSTDGMNANEILTAYSAGSNFNPETAKDKMSDVSNAEFLQLVINDTTSVSEETQLIVIPGNLNADITVRGKDIAYSDLNIYRLDANLHMKERCVQICETMATSNIGNVDFEGFYATRSKQDIKAGFNFEFKDITAEKAINLMPAVDTVMPMLKSFAGLLNCELAATASLDTNMNIITPTVNGVMRISGDDLTISDSDLFTSLAKKLKFDNKKVGKIQHMTVEGVIKDNVLEVFPFVLSMDRYSLAMSGKQNLDMSYRYHASLIKSPLLIRVGVDVYGQDFDNMKFKIGKPKYKTEKVPVFTTVIDETRINLAESIRNIFEKGVEAAIEENERQEAITDLRNEIGYVNAVDQESEELTEEEMKKLEEDNEEETTEETIEKEHDNE